jgi:hypothetical protein
VKSWTSYNLQAQSTNSRTEGGGNYVSPSGNHIPLSTISEKRLIHNLEFQLLNGSDTLSMLRVYDYRIS